MQLLSPSRGKHLDSRRRLSFRFGFAMFQRLFLLIQHGVLALEKFECFVILSFHSFDFAIFL
jgi:hypothetical protein